MKIYRLEIWAATDNKYKWWYIPLSDFYTTKEPLLFEKAKCDKITEDIDNNNPDDVKMKEYIKEKTGEDVVDTRFGYAEIREYELKI